MAAISVSEARVLVIQPWDMSALKNIEKAILASDIGITPTNDGKVLRLAFPQPTEERRKELAKQVKKYGEESKVAVIFLASFFPVLVNTIDGIERCDPKLVEVGRMYRLSGWQMFRQIYLPSALPSIFVGLKLALGIAWMAVVGSEMIAFRINDARTLMDYSIVFAGIIVIAVAGVLMDMVLGVIAKIATPWQQKKN